MTIKVRELDRVDSTNTYAKINKNELENMTLIFASSQTKGHGRMGREWDSGHDENILSSLFIKEKELIQDYDSLSILFAVIVLKLLQEYGLKNVKIKWPNDVFVGDKKIAGILLEGSIPEYIVVGVGININQKTLKFDTATSMFNLLSRQIPLDEIKEKYIKLLKNELSNFQVDKKSYLDIINTNNYLEDKKVKFEYQNSIFTGKVISIDKNNKIVISTTQETYHLGYGEIQILK